MKESTYKETASLRYCMLVPLVLMIASIVSSYFSYADAKRGIVDDLNNAMLALVKENSAQWTRQDTITALRKIYATTRKPVIYQASDANFKSATLKGNAYFMLALIDNKNAVPKIQGDKIVSDSIMLFPENAADGIAIQVCGFADYTIASVFAASDQTLPAVFLALFVMSMVSMYIWRRKECNRFALIIQSAKRPSIDGIKLTPMQRRFTQMLIDAPDMRLDKSTICNALWGNKSNAEESLYTLVRRTKIALSDSNMDIICNRGDSYEIRVNS